MHDASRYTKALGLVALTWLEWPLARGATLPVACTAASCTSGAFGSNGFVSSGAATLASSGSKLTVNQSTANVTLNWQSFNISANGTVQFVQPSATAVALNQIYDANATQIFGSLNANGRVFLINQNGIVFGNGAQVNVGGLVASTLNINPTAAASGLIAAGSNGSPAFQAFANGVSGAVTIDNGATLQTANGGEILVFAPTISNQGSISTPGGQTMLAAGDTIYLASSSDPGLRGLLVEVGGTGGTVTNGNAADASVTSPGQLVGQIAAQLGNVTLAGLAVNQLGRVTATTSINENGTIRLQAGDHGTIEASGAAGVAGTLVAGTGGRLTLGAHSDTEASLDSADPSTTVDSVPQLKSDINMSGYTIQMLQGSVARATSGTIEVTAEQAELEPLAPSTSDGSSFYLAPGAVLDVSGASVVLPVSSNVIPVQLRGAELANSPLQQNGPLRSQTVYIDIRQGTPLADVSGEIAAIGHNVVERNLTGGTVTIESHGDAILAPGSDVDVAGGEIQYTGGYLDTSYLLTTTGQIVNIGSASPNVQYAGIVTNTTVSNPKWGQSSTYASLPSTYSPGYVEGKDAGTLVLSAPQFIFDGSANTSTVTGINQRQPDQTVPSGALYRPYNEVPEPATLVIGSSSSDLVVGNVSIEQGLVLPTLQNADGTAFNPLTDPLPPGYTTSVLRPELLGTQGFGNVSIYTNGKFLEPAGTALEFPAGGSLSAHASVIDIDGGIDVPGGTIAMAAEPTIDVQPTSGAVLDLGPNAVLTARGEWINDNPLLYPNGNHTAPLFINGGSVSLTAQAAGLPNGPGLSLAPGSLIDVSGGGQLTSAGTLNPGQGGAIAIGAVTSSGAIGAAPMPIDLGATLRGYGLFDGASLSLTASSVCVAAANCSGGDPTVLWVSPAELASGGFRSYSLTADVGGLSVAPSTTVKLQQQNLVLPDNYSLLPDAATLIGATTVATLADQLREPVNLTLTQSIPATEITGSSNTLTITGSTPSLTIGAGAVIQSDPLADISLNSNVRILMDGTLRAPGGSIALDLTTGNLLEANYSGTQGIWIEGQGALDASGTSTIYPNALGQPTGTVANGGTVSLTAARGYIEVEPGSLIDVAGTSGTLMVTGVDSAQGHLEQIASAGGTVQLTAAEGVELAGSLLAAAGTAGSGLEQPAGGSFSLTLDGGNRGDYALSNGGNSTFPNGPREIVVSETQPPIIVAPGYAVPDSLSGYAYVSAMALQQAGFDTLSLKAASLPIAGGAVLPGNIDFVGNVTLGAARLISLDAASYSVSSGSTAGVNSAYVEFGNSDQTYDDVPAASSGSGTLDVSGGFIELYGSTALEGIGTALFNSSGDLRLRGILDTANSAATTFNGALDVAGNLDLTAQQIYPTSLTQFVLSTDPNSITSPVAGSITIQAAPGSKPDLLSAGGSITLSAGTVTQDGVLRAPFGSINIDAQTIALGPNSLTSTSADGQTIPFGTTQGGIDWTYPLANNNTIIYGTDGVAPPAQSVTLQGAHVNVQSGAVIDVSGGGDLQAYEWIDGTGGTNDVLSNSAANGGRPNQFAILPTLNANVAPYDPNISAGSTLTVGAAVYLSGMPGLPAGVYQLLPARYALLPGAFLVTQVSGYQDIQAGQEFPVLGGGTIISGYSTVAGTSFGNSRTSGFDVVPASVVLQQAQYTLTSADQFFANQAASANASAGTTPGAGQAAGTTVAVPRLPQDSGVLALIASDSLTLNGTLRTAAANGGLGAEVDVSSAEILVAPGTAATQPGEILLTSASLNALGAQTLLLGGLRAGDAIDTTAESVEVAAGASLTAPLILLTAQDQISVDAGASVTASGTAPGSRSYTVSGDGALLSVSAGPQSSITRGATTGAAGILTLAPGSSVTATGGSVYLDASNNVAADGTLALNGAALGVQSPAIVLGAAPAGTTGTVLGNDVLAASGLTSLLLQSGTNIAMYGNVNASAKNVTLDAPGLSGYGASSDNIVFSAADLFTLQNSQGNPVGVAGTGTGNLSITAPSISFGGGAVAASGFDKVALNSTGVISAAQNGGLSTAGNLSVTAARITSGADVDLSLAASGAVALLAPTQPAAPTAAASLGGSLSVSGAQIDVATQIVLPSGRVDMTTSGAAGGNGNLSIDSGGSINVAGLVQQYDGVNVASPGGNVSLVSAANLSLAGGSAINVSGGGANGGRGAGGSLSLSAPTGALSAEGALTGTGAPGQGTTVAIDAQQLGDFNALTRVLNAGGFNGGRSVRLRGPGDLVVDSGMPDAITATNVVLEADQGRIVVDGLIDAAGTAGGSVMLAAASDVVVNGTINASATAAGQNGGTVQLETETGQMLLNAGSTINVSAGAAGADGTMGAGGTVLLRAPSATVAALAAGGTGVALDGSIVGSTKTALEAFTAYQNTTGVISTTDSFADPSNPIYANAAQLMSNSGAITNALGQAANSAFVLEPGVEIDATVQSNGTGTLELDSAWNLYTWRFGANGNVPGVLTLRAQNGITFNASLSDGFAAASGTGAFTLPTPSGDSWSYRITAGADFTAANPLAVVSANPADVTISACVSDCNISGGGSRRGGSYTPIMVRTGDGFIDVSASGDFVLGSQQSMLYTAGYAGSGITLPGRVGSLDGLAYPTGGGNIQIAVDGDIVGAPTDQFVNAWLWRVGSPTTIPSGSATAWTVNFESFQQGVAALGGGNVSISAGGDISNLSASIPSIGVQVGGTTIADSMVQVGGGGNLTVTAGGSILGGSYYVGRGSALLQAGNDVGDIDPSLGGTGLAPIIGLGDADLTVTARGNLALAEILNPSLLNKGLYQGAGSAAVYFSTYGADSTVNLTSVGGNVALVDDNTAVISAISPSFLGGNVTDLNGSVGTLDILPPVLNVYALSGDVDVGRVLALTPSAGGNLQIFADQNFVSAVASNGSAGQLIVSDADPTTLPTPAAPQRTLQVYNDIVSALVTPLPDQHADAPVYLAADQAGQLDPVRVVALNGDIEFEPNLGGTVEGIWSAKPVQIVAGTDVVDLNLVAQNLSSADVTSVTAGRDIVYSQERLPDGAIAQDTNGIFVDGPGQLQVTAGRNVNLGTSDGINTRANLVNPALPTTGASVSVQAGVAAGAANYSGFIAQYITNSSEFDADLIAFVQDVEGTGGLSAAQAKQQFSGMTSTLQRTFVEQLFFELLGIYGSKEAASGNGDYSGAFAAINELFPGANPNLAKGQTNAYDGSIDLYFSQIYTDQGGNISLFAPGGEVNVGLALAPASFGIDKLPDQLGIVAETSGNVDSFSYSDFQVNESRVFAGNGGNILVWSTEGNIDAGRGAKTAISAPQINIVYDDNGQPAVTLRAAIAGSGIQALAATPGVFPGDVDLFAPHGVVNADDAGIVAGNLTIAATAVLGANNITVSGTSVGVPVTVTGLGASFAGASSTGRDLERCRESRRREFGDQQHAGGRRGDQLARGVRHGSRRGQLQGRRHGVLEAAKRRALRLTRTSRIRIENGRPVPGGRFIGF